MKTALMERPICSVKGHGHKELRPKEKQTPEQLWCGTWYDCVYPGCTQSTLLTSKELEAQIQESK